MATGTFQQYARSIDAVSLYDLVNTHTVNCALVTSSYTPSVGAAAGHYRWADVSANEIANGNGYTTGGATLGTKSTAATVADTGKYFTAADIVWTASGGNIPAWRYAVFYIVGTVAGVTNPLLGYVNGDSSLADVPATTDGNALTLDVGSTGIFARVASTT